MIYKNPLGGGVACKGARRGVRASWSRETGSHFHFLSVSGARCSIRNAYFVHGSFRSSIKEAPNIVGARVKLRLLERSDLARSIKWLNDPEIMKLLGRRHPMSMAEEEKWYEDYLKAGKSRIFAIEDENGEHVGNIGLHNIDKENRRASLGIVIGERERWGRGYGSAALMVALKYAFRELGLHKVSLRVFQTNKRAIKSYSRCGFKKEGVEREQVFKDGKFHDLFVMSILDREYESLSKETTKGL
jgi:RimJ/RimL family protein N-acetyltransferase